MPFQVMPLKTGDWRSSMAKGSMEIANNKGESKQPCLVPLYKEKYSENTLFVQII